MKSATNPLLKHGRASNTPYGFIGGLVEHLLHGFNVSQLDTFIEEPLCTLNFMIKKLIKVEAEMLNFQMNVSMVLSSYHRHPCCNLFKLLKGSICSTDGEDTLIDLKLQEVCND